MKMLKTLENNALHLVLILNEGEVPSTKVIGEIRRKLTSQQLWNATIYIISNISTPLYFERIRDLILNNVRYSFVFRYAGKSQEDLTRLLNQLKDKPFEVILEKETPTYANVLKELGIDYILLKEV